MVAAFSNDNSSHKDHCLTFHASAGSFSWSFQVDSTDGQDSTFLPDPLLVHGGVCGSQVLQQLTGLCIFWRYGANACGFDFLKEEGWR